MNDLEKIVFKQVEVQEATTKAIQKLEKRIEILESGERAVKPAKQKARSE